jgi:hypothetical protein
VTETPIEGPAEDVAEQRTEVLPDLDAADAPAAERPAEVSWDADPADAQAQVDEVPIDEDEWR